MTEANNHIEVGDRVMLRGSDPPKTGKVTELLTQGEGFVVPDPGDPPNMAWVRWDGQPRRSAERFADLIKLTEGNDQQ